MKKIIYITIILAAVAFMLPQIASADGGPQAWASGTYTLGSGGQSITAAEYQLSSNVWLYYTADASFVNYGLGSLHKSGNRSYATSNDTTLIYYSDKSAGDTVDSDSAVDPAESNFNGAAL